MGGDGFGAGFFCFLVGGWRGLRGSRPGVAVLLGLRIFRSRFGLLVVRVCADRAIATAYIAGSGCATRICDDLLRAELAALASGGAGYFFDLAVVGLIATGFSAGDGKAEGRSGEAISCGRSNVRRRLDGTPHWLNDPMIADHVVATLRRGAELRHYHLRAYVVMSNHVHVLILPLVPLPRITNGVKGVSAHEANAILNRTGRHFWQDESF